MTDRTANRLLAAVKLSIYVLCSALYFWALAH